MFRDNTCFLKKANIIYVLSLANCCAILFSTLNSMKKKLNLFIKKYLLFSLVVILTGGLIFSILPQHFYSIHIVSFFLIFLTTLTTFIVIAKSLKKKLAAFTNYFMISTIVKLFIYFGFIVSYLIFSGEKKLSFIIVFFILYFLFTSYEVIILQRYIKIQDLSHDK